MTKSMTSVEIDRNLLIRAKKIFGVTTTKAAVNAALEDAVLRAAQLEAVEFFSTMEIDEHPDHNYRSSEGVTLTELPW